MEAQNNKFFLFLVFYVSLGVLIMNHLIIYSIWNTIIYD